MLVIMGGRGTGPAVRTRILLAIHGPASMRRPPRPPGSTRRHPASPTPASPPRPSFRGGFPPDRILGPRLRLRRNLGPPRSRCSRVPPCDSDQGLARLRFQPASYTPRWLKLGMPRTGHPPKTGD